MVPGLGLGGCTACCAAAAPLAATAALQPAAAVVWLMCRRGVADATAVSPSCACAVKLQ